jgi:tyrosyl-tRNA synthetase
MIRPIQSGIVDVLPATNLNQFLSQPKRIKLGFDPTSDFLHLGHSVLLRKLRAFQQEGHTPVVIIGDFTARIGDPTGKNTTRPQLDPEVVSANGRSFLDTMGKFLDIEKCEIIFNSTHLESLQLNDIIKLQSLMTVQQLLAKQDFSNRLKNETPISLHEFMYPLLQGFDSFVAQSDVELGGIDQKFNISIGRTIQRGLGSEVQQIGLLMPILVGTDGHQKMSKSLGNTIGINEHPLHMFSKLEKISDSAVNEFITLLTDCGPEDFPTNPREKQRQMAIEVTATFHGMDKALEAKQSAESIVFSGLADPTDSNVPTALLNGITFPIPLANLLKTLNLVKSTSDARRKIRAGSVVLSGIKVSDDTTIIPSIEILNNQIIRLSKKEIFKFIQQ